MPALDGFRVGRLTDRLYALPHGAPQCQPYRFGKSPRRAAIFIVSFPAGERLQPITPTENQAAIGRRTGNTSCFAPPVPAWLVSGQVLKNIISFCGRRKLRFGSPQQTPAF